MQPIFSLPTIIEQLLGSPKDKIKLEKQGAYSISCGDCNNAYIGSRNRRILPRCSEHMLSTKNQQSTSALFQHEKPIRQLNKDNDRN